MYNNVKMLDAGSALLFSACCCCLLQQWRIRNASCLWLAPLNGKPAKQTGQAGLGRENVVMLSHKNG